MFSGLSKYLVEKGAGSAVGEEWGERKVGGGGVSTHRWLKRLSETPNSMWITPRMMDIFILKEFRKVSLLLAMFQIFAKSKSK